MLDFFCETTPAWYWLCKVEGHVLAVQPLLAELKKLNFSGKIFPHEVFGLLRHRRLVNISVEGTKVFHVLWRRKKKN